VIDVSCIYGLPGQRRTIMAEKASAANTTKGSKALDAPESSHATDGGGAAASATLNEPNAEASVNGDGTASETATAAVSGSNGGGSASGGGPEGSRGSGENRDGITASSSQDGGSSGGAAESGKGSAAAPPAENGGGVGAAAAEGGDAQPVGGDNAEHGIDGGGAALQESGKDGEPPHQQHQQQPAATGWAYDHKSSSVMKLSNGMVLYLREVKLPRASHCLFDHALRFDVFLRCLKRRRREDLDCQTMPMEALLCTCIWLTRSWCLFSSCAFQQVSGYLALVCLLRADNLTKRGLIDYNIDCFKGALAQVFQP